MKFHFQRLLIKFYQNSVTVTCLLTVFGCFCVPVWQRLYSLKSCLWPLQKVSTNPWFRLMLWKQGRESLSMRTGMGWFRHFPWAQHLSEGGTLKIVNQQYFSVVFKNQKQCQNPRTKWKNKIYIKIGSVTVLPCPISETEAEENRWLLELACCPLNFTWEASASSTLILVLVLWWLSRGRMGLKTKQGGKRYGDLGEDFRSLDLRSPLKREFHPFHPQ